MYMYKFFIIIFWSNWCKSEFKDEVNIIDVKVKLKMRWNMGVVIEKILNKEVGLEDLRE